MIRSIQRCEEGSNMHNGHTYTLQLVEELGRLKLADALTEAFDIGTQAPSRGRQSGGSQGGGRHGGDRAGHGRTTNPNPICEEGDDSGEEESWLGTNWVLSEDGDRTPRPTSSAGVGPSHTTGHEGIVPAQTTSHAASTDYKDPPRMSPPVFSGSAHDGGCIFVPTPSMPTPPLVHIPAEDIEPVEGLRRSQRPPVHASDYGTSDGKIRPVRAYGRKRKDH
nr:hypothetical protein CFP56_23310 [Quercus suber]